jgi:TolB protein
MKTLYIFLLMTACYKNSSVPMLAKTRTVVFVKQSNNKNHLWLMDLDSAGKGSNARRLTADSEAENYPSWSPDSRHIIYQRDMNGSAIYMIDLEQKHPIRLSPTPGFDVTPSWSPDGKKIIFSRLDGPMAPGQIPKTEIHVMNADGSGDHIILPKTVFSVEPRWSANNEIVFMSDMNGGQHIFTMKTDGTALKQLTTLGNNGDPSWSPNGQQIAFGSNREGNGKLNIFIMNRDGSNTIQLTHFESPDEAGDTNWSPDGKKIIFEYDINGHLQSDPNAYAEVWTINTDGSHSGTTSQPCNSVGCAPRWKPE